ncbi:MAG: NAD(P)H-hydrate dehydratase [Burkholderiaceae bacterium]
MSDSNAFLSLEKIRAVETRALAGADAGELMYRAASALAAMAESLLIAQPVQTSVTALIGPGNNGGDALLALMMLEAGGYQINACSLGQAPNEGTDAHAVWARFQAQGGTFIPIEGLPDLLPALSGGATRGRHASLLIDGMFGIGLRRPLEGGAARTAQLTHRLDSPLIAVDVPSGINCDTGAIVGGARGAAVKASHTITLIGNKPGLYTGPGRAHAGQVSVNTLGIATPAPSGLFIDQSWVATRLRKRQTNSHKGSFGSVGVLGGAPAMPGAALLAARAAQATGAGKVTIMSPVASVFDPGSPQLMSGQLERPADLDAHVARISCLVAGCGLGTDQLASSLLARALVAPIPAVIDADALNLVAGQGAKSDLRGLMLSRGQSVPTILTPHPLEAARLLGQSVAQIEDNRVTNAGRLALEWQSTVILKGAGSVIAAPDGRWAIIGSGGPALATGGSGDLLAGIAGALLAQGYPAWEAAAMAAWLHGNAADLWAREHPRQVGLNADTLLQHLIESINQS